VLVGPKAQKVLQGDVRVNEVIIYDNRDLHAGLNGKIGLVKKLRGRKFDLVIDLRDSFWSRLIGGSRWGIPLFRRLQSSYKRSHAVNRYLGILRSRGIPSEDAAPGFYLSDSEKQAASEFLSRSDVSDRDLILGIHPGGGWLYKLWDAERFAALGDGISEKYGAKVLVFAGPDEASLQDQVMDSMRSSPISVKGIGLRETAALIQKCDLYIGNDTGPMHMAAAVGTQVVAIFGPTDAGRSGPYGHEHVVIAEEIECNPCHPGRNPGGCGRGSCQAMEAVSLQQVLEAVDGILDKKKEQIYGNTGNTG